MATQQPVGYRAEIKPGEYLFYSVADYARETYLGDAQVWGLYEEPQSACSAAVAVYKGPYWIQPRYVYGKDVSEFTPLYLGPMISKPWPNS